MADWTIHYPPGLPIAERIGEIREAWRTNQVLIVSGATGSGKTTQLPKVALEIAGDAPGIVGCTQPRRLAATAMAARLARELGVQYGREVGCQVRFDDRTDRLATRVKFMTDGILLAETRGDPALRRYSCLIVDEAHERSLNIDFILGYLKQLLPKRPDLKIAISSATLDAGRFSEFYGGAPVIEVAGRQYPIEDCYLEPDQDEELADLVGRGVRFIDEYDHDGDILVFLPGEREIRDACELLQGWKLPRTEVMPLFGRLSLREQERVFTVGKHRRIVLATNVAETSVTIPGIDYVVDSGLVRLSRYNPRTQVQELRIEVVSQAAARQRRGRCGRLRDGVCLHLYGEETLARSPEYTDCEIKRTALAGVILEMALLRLGRIEHFPFLDPPGGAGVREGRRTLTDIGALTEAGNLTEEGRRIAVLPLDPHLGKMLLAGVAAQLGCEVLILTAFLSLQDPRERPLDAQQKADEKHRQWRDERSDFLGILKLWNFLFPEGGEGVSGSALRRKCRDNFLNYPRIREWRNLAQDLGEHLARHRIAAIDSLAVDLERVSYDLLHMALLAGVPRHVGCYDAEEKLYRGTGGRKFHIFPGSALFRRKKPCVWVMSFALVESSRLYARQNAEIRPDYLEKVAPHLCAAIYSQAAYDPESGFVYARERLSFGGLMIHGGRRVHYGKSHPVETRQVFIREALAGGKIVSRHPEVRRYLKLLEELAALEIKLRRPGTVVDYEALFRHFDALLPAEVISQQSLEQWLGRARPGGWLPEREAVMQNQYRPIEVADYPDQLVFAGHRFRLVYIFDPGGEEDGVSLIATAGELPLIPAAELEYAVPGWLPEKVEALLRHLPKADRARCMPLAETVQAYRDFLAGPDSGRAAGLNASLAAFLTQWTGHSFQGRDFAGARLPEYLVMKIAEVDDSGAVVARHRELPEHHRQGSRLSRLISGVGKHVSAASGEWPAGEFPLEVALADGSVGYPALVPEGEGVARQLFLDGGEARWRHAEGLARLFRLQQAGLVKFVRRDLKPSNALKLGIVSGDPDRRWVEELADRALRQALGGGLEALWRIRSRAEFDRAALAARDGFANRAEACLGQLEGWQRELDGRIDGLARRARERAPETAREAEAALAIYFRAGFQRDDEGLARYDRWLRALGLRLERALNDPAKDRVKAEPLASALERRRLAFAAGADPASNAGFRVYQLLLEEAVIAAFAPEVRPAEKASVARLEAAWEAVRL